MGGSYGVREMFADSALCVLSFRWMKHRVIVVKY